MLAVASLCHPCSPGTLSRTGRPTKVGGYSSQQSASSHSSCFLVRFGLFHLFESPKFLLSQGRQAEAVAVVHGIAYRNNKKTWLTEEILDAIVDAEDAEQAPIRVSASSVLKQNLNSFSLSHIQPLFQNRKLGLTHGAHLVLLGSHRHGIPTL